MSELKGKVGQKGRILYVEPNSVFGKIGNVPLTPDYSDLCISFNLIVEVVSRFKQNAAQGENDTMTYVMSWTSRLGLDQDKNWVSFLTGEQTGKNGETFLTTYYTNTHYEDILKKNIVEGLGIENITVAFENYYTPTVTIKFVDQRGASLFGREEATHYDDKLTIDNIFGAFFTAPYPKFKLQIKGFYGKPVTLQLTCSGFKGMLNSKTGNFEATATFIGYSYSLLTDIPFQYIVAAPFCEYVGKDYWNSKASSEEWRTFKSNGNPMPRIYDFLEHVKNAMSDESLLNMLSEEDNEMLQSGEKEKAELGTLYSDYTRFIEALSNKETVSTVKNFVIGNESLEKEQMLVMCEEEKIDTTGYVSESYDKLITQFNLYNESYASTAIPTTSLPNGFVGSLPDLECIELFDIKEEGETGITVRCLQCDEMTVENFTKIKFSSKSDGSGDSIKMETNTAEILANLLNQDVTNNIHRYAYLFDLGDFRKRINDRMNEIDENVNRIERQKERDYVRLAQSKLTMVPYIGNVFKMIMAHVETLVYIMYKCFDNIKEQELNGLRKASYLHVNLKKTDILPDTKENIPAWPMVTKASSDNNENRSLEDENTIGWVGDFSPNFEEEKLVRALFLACKKTNQGDINYEELNANIGYVPVAPNDLNEVKPVFDVSINKMGISYLAGMLGIRAAQLFGVMEKGNTTPEIAEVMGKMDAYNYYLTFKDKSQIKEKITDVSGNKPLGDKLLDIMLCKPEEDNMGETKDNFQVHPFETNKSIMSSVISGGRHPMFRQNGNSLNYVHYYTKNGVALVPSVIKEFDAYKDDYPYDGSGNDYYFRFNTKRNENIEQNIDLLFNSNSLTLFRGREHSEDYVKHINYEKFNVLTKPSLVNGVLNRYEELKTGNFKIAGESYSEDFSKVLDRYWSVSESSYTNFLKKNNILKVKTKNKIIEDIQQERQRKCRQFNNKLNEGSLPVKKENEFSWDLKDGTTVSIDSLCIPLLYLYSNENYFTTLNGSNFYYLQNDNKTELEDNVVDKAKALLLLHSVSQCNINPDMLNFLKKDKSHASIQSVPYGYMLLLGGLIWRMEYIEKHGEDPILFRARNTKYIPTIKPLFHKSGNVYRFSATTSTQTNVNEYYNVSLESLFGGSMPDYYISNVLKMKFLEFVSDEWRSIKEKIELVAKTSTNERFYLLGDSLIEIHKGLESELAGHENDDAETYNNIINNYYAKCFGDTVKNFKYLREMSTNEELFAYLDEDSETCQKLLKRLYCDKTVVLDMSNSKTPRTGNTTSASGSITKTDVNVDEATMKNYLRAFSDTLKKIVDSPSDVVVDDTVDNGSPEDEDIAEFTRDLALPIYLYLKMLWDKWLSSSSSSSADHEFTIKNFFNNFVFIDSFYRNITNRLMLNCQILLDVFSQNNSYEDSTVFKAIGDITTKHHCMFLAIPDFIDNLSSKDPKEAVSALESMFVPVPFSEMTPPERNNKFVIIYVPKLSETPSELNNYKEDGFNIWSYNDAKQMDDTNLPGEITKVNNTTDLPPILAKNTGDFAEDEDVSRYGYFVPSFGLAYGYQHNHLFKDVNLNMETPVITSAVINTLSHIAYQGAGNEHKVAFVGQDLYPVFSNYSYQCEFEMMGCAQIQPLMYFQLMNVPMWRGTYMIFNVTHVMTPGNMVTRVKAMKLSNRAVPYSNAWFTKNLNYKDEDSNGSNDGCEVDSGDGGAYNGYVATAGGIPGGNEQSKLTQAEKNKRLNELFGGSPPARKPVRPEPSGFKDKYMTTITFVNHGKSHSVQIHKGVAKRLKDCLEEISKTTSFVINDIGGYSWRCIKRPNGACGSSLSNHSYGLAIDINFNGGVNPYISNGKPLASGDSNTKIRTWNSPVVKIMNKYGFGWGGAYGDYMHFSYLGGH